MWVKYDWHQLLVTVSRTFVAHGTPIWFIPSVSEIWLALSVSQNFVALGTYVRFIPRVSENVTH